MQYQSPRGTYDILPPGAGRSWVEDVSRWHWLERIFRELCALYGYEEVRSPIFETTELFRRSVGDGTDIVAKEMYDFTTRGGDLITLRPEGTAGALRAFVQHRLYTERPVTKLYYLGPIFRYERPAKGRYRQHHQAGIEAVGANGPDIDAEVIGMAVAFFQRLGIPNLTVKLNSLGTTESRARYVQALRTYAEPLLGEMSEDNQRRYHENALRMLDSKEEKDRVLLADAPKLVDFNDDESRAHYEGLKSLLTTLGITFEDDPMLVRGFDYYTRTVFEIQSPDIGAQSALGGGGRYNKLVEQIGGPSLPGIGFGLGIERALIALEASQVAVPSAPGIIAFLCPLGADARNESVRILGQLRGAGIAADMDYTGRKLKAMLEQADERRARFALILGDDEIANGIVQLRDMTTKEQKAVSIAELIATLGNSETTTG